MPCLRRGSPLIISVHGIAMETLLRAIEMSDSSTLRINPSLAAQDARARVCKCVGFRFVFVLVCMHLGTKFLWRIVFLISVGGSLTV